MSEMLEVVEKSCLLESGAPGAVASESIAFRGVDVVTPDTKLLARQLALEVRPGQSLLVTGPNGSGKTSLFR